MRRGGRRTRAKRRTVMVWAMSTFICCSLPQCGSAQTVEPRYEPHATGAATIIYPDETALGAQDVVDMLQWYVPGATIMRCGDGTVEVALRGGHQSLMPSPSCPDSPPNPLLIIDGVKISNENFSLEIRSLNPNRVERIEVLRDLASTAIYGGRAARGAILVFTRRR